MSILSVAIAVTVDGRPVHIMREGCGSVSEALAELAQDMEEVGSSPPREGAGAAVSAPVEAAKRTRRTKEQIAADEAAKVKADTPPPLPSGPSLDKMSAPPITSVFDPSPAPSAPPAYPLAFVGAPPVVMTSDPPVMPVAPSVEFKAPPAAPVMPSPEAIARGEVQTALDRLYGSIPVTWRPDAAKQLAGMFAPLGGEVGALDLVQCSEAKTAIASYQAMCDAAQKGS